MTSITDINSTSSGSGTGRPRRQACNVASALKPETRKLRASCDKCYLAKIRCSKGTPTCSRCSSHGFSCQYSPSQRIGKPRRLIHERSDSQSSINDRIPESPSSKTESLPSLFDWNFEPTATSAGSEPDQTQMSQELSFAWQQALDNIPNHRTGLEEPDRSPTFTFPSTARSVGSTLPQATPTLSGHLTTS